MALCNVAAVLQRVADSLGVGVANLDPRWPDMAAASHKSSVAWITGAFGLKAWGAAQIVSSDQFATWHEDLAFFFTMLRGAALASYSMDALKEFDPREMLKGPVSLSFGGKPLPPDGTSPVGGIESGRMSAYDEERARGAHLFR